MPTTTAAVRFLSGTGSPQGVVAAPYGSEYYQTDATSGNEIWDKATGTGNTGWRVRGSGSGSVATKTANYTATQSDYFIKGDTTSGSITITLPTAVGISGKVYYVEKMDSTANALVLATTSSQTINGATTRSTDVQWDVLGVISDNANWLSLTPQDAADSYAEVSLSVPDVLQVGVGTARYYLPNAKTIVSVRASVGTAPTGAAILMDVNKNGTTIFTTQANRPSIAASTFTALAPAINVTNLVSGDYITVDVDQVGSVVAGSDLIAQIGLA